MQNLIIKISTLNTLHALRTPLYTTCAIHARAAVRAAVRGAIRAGAPLLNVLPNGC